MTDFNDHELTLELQKKIVQSACKNAVYDTFHCHHQIFVEKMSDDAVSDLLRKHFKKVRECLLDKNNFDVLTGFRFKFTADKAIENTQDNTEDEYINPEYELSQKTIEKCLPVLPRSISDVSMEDFGSEEFQAETDFEADNAERRTISEASSSLLNETFNDSEERIENSRQDQLKPSRKSLLERPGTPMLEMYDSEDDTDYYDSKPKKIEGSHKFILRPEQFQAGDLNLATTPEHLEEEKRVDRFEELEILPRRKKSVPRIPTRQETEQAFHKELEMYKRDIKLEKTIKSMSCGTNLPYRTPIKSQQQSCSYDQCSKIVHHGKKSDIVRKTKDEPRDTRLETNLGLDVPRENSAKYLKNYFDEASTNVCQKVSESSRFNIEQPYSDGPTKFPVDDETLKYIFEKNVKNQNLECQEGMEIPDNYLKMNHLEIQKEMVRRIEDLYKTDDGK